MPSEKDGPIWGKFRVRRTDGRDAPGCKHDGCAYFVLDLTHDGYAAAAALAYADACEAEYPKLANSIRERVDSIHEEASDAP